MLVATSRESSRAEDPDLGIERVARQVLGHVQPVNAANKFTPAQNLPNESFGCGQWRVAGAVSRLGCVHHLARVQQFEVERAAQVRVVEPGFTGPHGIFVLAK